MVSCKQLTVVTVIVVRTSIVASLKNSPSKSPTSSSGESHRQTIKKVWAEICWERLLMWMERLFSLWERK
jgi:hypothetical protein